MRTIPEMTMDTAATEAYYAACDARDAEILAYAEAVDWWDYSHHGRVVHLDKLVAEVLRDMRDDLSLTRAELPSAEQALIASMERWDEGRGHD